MKVIPFTFNGSLMDPKDPTFTLTNLLHQVQRRIPIRSSTIHVLNREFLLFRQAWNSNSNRINSCK